MSVSQQIGGLPILSAVFDYGPVAAGVMVSCLSFGLVWIFMKVDGIPKNDRRRKYKAFLWGESFCLPACVAAAVLALQVWPAPNDFFYTKSWFHYVALAVGFVISIGLEIGAVTGHQYTIRDELMLHKLWHTFMFGIVFYWLASTIVAVGITVLYQGKWFAGVIVLIPILGFVYANYLDSGHTWRDWTWLRRR